MDDELYELLGKYFEKNITRELNEKLPLDFWGKLAEYNDGLTNIHTIKVVHRA